ncbi:MAG: NADH-quinone oxidoreductase subunit NuoE [Alphaproteobacteria bacterium]|nr:NADH-quinone oxidoreductase subunit NuoE [Alphaproteobacteria bacterium]
MSDAFAFDDVCRARAETIVGRYPEGRQQSAVIPLLDLAQRQAGGWLPTEAIEYVAGYLDMPKIRVLEVASFYSMFNLEPVGKNFVQLCRTTPCWLRGSDDLRAVAKDVTGCGLGETSPDGAFTVVEVECLGACCNAPMVQINDEYYEDLTAESFKAVLEALKRGETPEPGSQAGRTGSEPVEGLTTLTGEGA